jgi:predicted transcriptional regulator
MGWSASNLQFNKPCQLRNVLAPATTNAIRLVEKVTPVTQRRLGILVDRDDDRLHMRVAPAFARRLDANLCQGF